jgi:hypothetical protein
VYITVSVPQQDFLIAVLGYMGAQVFIGDKKNGITG